MHWSINQDFPVVTILNSFFIEIFCRLRFMDKIVLFFCSNYHITFWFTSRVQFPSKSMIHYRSCRLDKCFCLLSLIWVGWCSHNNSETLKTITLWNLKYYFVTFSKTSLGTYAPDLVSLTWPSLQTLGETQTGVFLISGFLVNLL